MLEWSVFYLHNKYVNQFQLSVTYYYNQTKIINIEIEYQNKNEIVILHRETKSNYKPYNKLNP